MLVDKDQVRLYDDGNPSKNANNLFEELKKTHIERLQEQISTVYVTTVSLKLFFRMLIGQESL